MCGRKVLKFSSGSSYKNTKSSGVSEGIRTWSHVHRGWRGGILILLHKVSFGSDHQCAFHSPYTNVECKRHAGRSIKRWCVTSVHTAGTSCRFLPR
jgi:hypothetical protein